MQLALKTYRRPTTTRPGVVSQIERWCREHNWSARRIVHELDRRAVCLSVRSVSRILERLGAR